jgi:hypothetical protein
VPDQTSLGYATICRTHDRRTNNMIEYFTIVSGTEAGFRTLANCRIEQIAQKVRIQIKSTSRHRDNFVGSNAAISRIGSD